MLNSPQISHVKDPKSSNHAPMNSIEPKSATKISIQLNSAKSTKKNQFASNQPPLSSIQPKLAMKNSIQLKSTI
jgi:hypothetical protein